MKSNLIALTALSLSACAAYDKPSLSAFKPTSDGFEYVAKAGPYYTLEGGEDDRIEWLESYLSDNSLCSAGYELTSRVVVQTNESAFGKVHDVRYVGVCL